MIKAAYSSGTSGGGEALSFSLIVLMRFKFKLYNRSINSLKLRVGLILYSLFVGCIELFSFLQDLFVLLVERFDQILCTALVGDQIDFMLIKRS